MKIYVDACMKPLPLTCLVDGETGGFSYNPHTYTTHNQAEYAAILEGICWGRLADALEVMSDSELAVSQINSALGRGKSYKCNDTKLRLLLRMVESMVQLREEDGRKTTITWIPREENIAGIRIEKGK